MEEMIPKIVITETITMLVIGTPTSELEGRIGSMQKMATGVSNSIKGER